MERCEPYSDDRRAKRFIPRNARKPKLSRHIRTRQPRRGSRAYHQPRSNGAVFRKGSVRDRKIGWLVLDASFGVGFGFNVRQGNSKPEDRTVPEVASNPSLAAVVQDDVFYDREPKPG